MGECVEGCGACCNPIASSYGPFEIATAPPRETELVWMRENTTLIRGGAGKLAARAHMDSDRLLVSVDSAGGLVLDPWFYSCRWYDEETARCTNYENRPDMCRDYPWGDTGPSPAKAIPKTCGYLVDLGRDPVPVKIRGTR